jgi:DNA-binding response OmpR family regulator
MMCARCADLEYQLAELKRELNAGRVERLDQAYLIAQRHSLTRQEAIILTALYTARGRILSVNQLDEALPEAPDGLARSATNITVRIHNIRKKTSHSVIKNHHGSGWSITDLGRLLCDEALEAPIGVAA